jgi:hypothetical protein
LAVIGVAMEYMEFDPGLINTLSEGLAALAVVGLAV